MLDLQRHVDVIVMLILFLTRNLTNLQALILSSPSLSISFPESSQQVTHTEALAVLSQLRPGSVFVVIPGLVKPGRPDPRGASIFDGVDGYPADQQLSVGGGIW